MNDKDNIKLLYEEMSNEGLPTARFPYNLKAGDTIVANVSRLKYPYRFGHKAVVTVVAPWENGQLLVQDSENSEQFQLHPDEVLRRV